MANVIKKRIARTTTSYNPLVDCFIPGAASKTMDSATVLKMKAEKEQKLKVAFSKSRESNKCTKRIEKQELSIEKKMQSMKPTTTRYDPLKECFNPVGKSTATNSTARVKEGNKRIDAATIAKLKAENAQKMKIVPITSNKKVEVTVKISSSKEDPFTRRPTKPKMACGGESVQSLGKPAQEKRLSLEEVVENIQLPIEKTLEDPFTRRPTKPKMACGGEAVQSLGKPASEKKLPLHEQVENIPLPIEKTLEDEIKKKSVNYKRRSVQSTKKRAPETLEQEPKQKKIKLTITIKKRSEGENNRKSEKYRIKH